MEETVAWDSVTLLLCERFLYLKIVFKKDYRTDFHLKVSPIVVVRVVGLEPTSLAALEPKSSMFTNFIIPAYMSSRNILPLFLRKFLHCGDST